MDQFFQINIGQIGQVVAILIFIGAIFQQIKGDIKNQADRLLKIEAEIMQFRQLLIANARQDERMNAMDQRMLSQGRRIDQIADQIIKRKRTVVDDGSSERI